MSIEDKTVSDITVSTTNAGQRVSLFGKLRSRGAKKGDHSDSIDNTSEHEKNAMLELLFKKYHKPLIGFLGKQFGADNEIAKEIVQETFIALKRHIDGGGTLENEKALIYTIARNKMVDYHRRSGNWNADAHVALEEENLPSQSPTQEEMVLSQEQIQQLETVILTLPPRCQEVFVLRVFEEMKHQEIAVRCGISKSMVEKHLSKAFKILKQEIELRPASIGA